MISLYKSESLTNQTLIIKLEKKSKGKKINTLKRSWNDDTDDLHQVVVHIHSGL
jgi:hypothetical protein